MVPKILAMYLPQFHQIPENDEWWGEGFTEWNTVKGAKPLFEGHDQPVVPLCGYYDLMQPDTLTWQISLLNEYNIYGLCIYHYWFKNGRQILEKPAEKLLERKDLDTHYCFCWANESWVRTWSNINDCNVWAAKYETNSGDDNSGILLEQQYGTPDEWKKHFDYLVNFFKDDRYIKVEKKPVFVIYRPQLIFCLQDMMDLWNELAVSEGFSGIFFVLANCNSKLREIADLELVHEPQNAFHMENIKKNTDLPVEGIFEYEEVVKKSLEHIAENNKISYGGFIGYDDTPRRGHKGNLISGCTKGKFRNYFEMLVEKNNAYRSPFIFFNAWNEWGEGMHLEPDEKDRYDYLEIIRDTVEKYADMDIEKAHDNWDKLSNVLVRNGDSGNNSKSVPDKFEVYFNLLHKWLLKKEMNRSFADYLLSFNYHRIAIYGAGVLCKHLITELMDSDVEVTCVIDRADNVSVNGNIPVIKASEISYEVDAIVVTVTYQFDEVCKELNKYNNAKVISLEQVIMEC